MQVLKPTFKVGPLSEAKPKSYAHAIIYGYPGSRKTTLAETAPGPRLWLNCDPSGSHVLDWDSGDNIAPRHPDTDQVITQFNYTDGNDWRLLDRIVKSMEAVGSELSSMVGTVILDTGTYAAKMCDAFILSDTSVKRVVASGESKMSQPDYGTHAVLMDKLLGRILALPCHCVVTAHVADKRYTDETGESRTMELPNFIGNVVGGEAPGAFDLVGFTRLVPDKDNRAGRLLLQVEHGEGRVAKVRTKANRRFAESTVADPNLTEIFTRILNPTKESA